MFPWLPELPCIDHQHQLVSWMLAYILIRQEPNLYSYSNKETLWLKNILTEYATQHKAPNHNFQFESKYDSLLLNIEVKYLIKM